VSADETLLRSYAQLVLARADAESRTKRGTPLGGPVVALAHAQPWTGPDTVLLDERYVDVRWCPSELAVRDALLDPVPAERALLLLTPLSHLGDDVAARVYRRRVFRPDPQAALAAAFGAVGVDSQVPSWLVRALVALAPREGYGGSGARIVDADRAWRAYLQRALGLDVDGGLGEVLRWCADGEIRLTQRSASEQDEIAVELAGRVRGAGGPLAAVRAGHGVDAIALGLVARCLADGPDGSARVAARVRLETVLGGWRFDAAVARLWADASERLVLALLESDAQAAQRHLQDADRLVAELDATALADTSDILTSGLGARLRRVGEAIDSGDRAALTAAAANVRRHRQTGDGAGRVATLVERLLRWLDTDLPVPETLADAARRYVDDGAYADLARTTLRHGGGEPRLDDALRAVVARADARRETEERLFADLLAGWLPHAETGDALLGVEDVLDVIVAPVARARPTLVVVMDGMAHRVVVDLLEDLGTQGWVELRRAGHPQRTLALAALPSVTTFSRTSLLAGQLQAGIAKDERLLFAEHPALVAANGGSAPVLFHKGALADPQSGLTGTVREAIASDAAVVGAVVNAVDDHLARSEQLDTAWSVRNVLPLRWLLEAARDADRTVVLVADHGHVLERAGVQRRHGGQGGERWRTADGSVEDGEVLVEGRRVLAGEGRAILAWSETLRYAPPKHGYHGGATAQEVLAPVVVLAPRLTTQIDGFTEAPYDPPAWWTGSPDIATPELAAAAPAVGEQLALDGSGAGSGGGWVAALLASETLAQQRALAARTPLDDERIAQVLVALDAGGGTLLVDALAQSLQVAPARMPGLLATLRRLLNVDGYDALEVDETASTVRLHRATLLEQFGISV
jgi:hypothetical protein